MIGGRTDHQVRVFVDIHPRSCVTCRSRASSSSSSRRTYSYHATHERQAVPARRRRRKSRPAIRARDRVWISAIVDVRRLGLPVREAMSGGAPWWFAFEDNKEVPIPEHKMPGDKGVVIRRYAARLGGVEQTSPSLSILCDKLELYARRLGRSRWETTWTCRSSCLCSRGRATSTKWRSATRTPLVEGASATFVEGRPETPPRSTGRQTRGSRSEISCLGCAHRSGWRRRRGAGSSASPPRRAPASRATTRFAWPPPRKVG